MSDSDARARLPEHLREVARDAAAIGLHGLTDDQLDGLDCAYCGRRSRAMVPLEGLFGGRQLFECGGCRSAVTD